MQGCVTNYARDVSWDGVPCSGDKKAPSNLALPKQKRPYDTGSKKKKPISGLGVANFALKWSCLIYDR